MLIVRCVVICEDVTNPRIGVCEGLVPFAKFNSQKRFGRGFDSPHLHPMELRELKELKLAQKHAVNQCHLVGVTRFRRADK